MLCCQGNTDLRKVNQAIKYQQIITLTHLALISKRIAGIILFEVKKARRSARKEFILLNIEIKLLFK